MRDKKLWRDASGRLTFDMDRVAAEEYAAVTRAVADAFTLFPDGSLVVGLESMFQDFRRGEQVVGFEWDVWMGFIVVARTKGSEPLVQDIALWLRSSRWAGAGESVSQFIGAGTAQGVSMTLDTAIPGFPEIDDWPTAPEPPFHLHGFGTYRDPEPWCTAYVELKDSAGTLFRFFLDRFLGRLCYGSSDGAEDAAFIRKGASSSSRCSLPSSRRRRALWRSQ